ncbi:MAG: hypothetical protein KME30_01570 [Iphinoe sp. HA4291-MV1]|jgi:hypothetical protein|nr:hypothetical protein [Iphinoe sp. HA4291-MV1]
MMGASRLIRCRLVVLPQFGLTQRLWYLYLYPHCGGTRAAALLPKAVIDFCFEAHHDILVDQRTRLFPEL